MVRMFGCSRSKNSHIERKKSKCDYQLEKAPSSAQLMEVEKKVNEIIGRNLQVEERFVKLSDVPEQVDLSKLPEMVGDTNSFGYHR
jgi:alanyl-tRNA synthetase